MKIIELREYKIKSGKTQEWLELMGTEILPYQRNKGMNVLNTYLQTDDEGNDYFVWLREFENEESRQRLYAETYDDWWKTEMRGRVFSLIEESAVSVKLLKPLDM